MSAKLWSIPALVILTANIGLEAQTPRSVHLSVKETNGIRRNNYPVEVRVPFPKGSLSSAANARLVFNGAEVPAQLASEAQWPDGSTQWLAVNFNTSIAPNEAQAYALEYGDSVKAVPPSRGLSVSEDADAIQVASVRFNKKGAPLLLSVKYRNEDIGRGDNGLSVLDASGKSHDLTNAESLKVEIVKRGPVYVTVRYTGRIVIDSNYSAPFVMTVEMPTGKTWVKIAAAVEDPGKRLREIVFQTPVALGPFPWVWDFGTDHWTYGSFRNPSDSVVVTQNLHAAGTGNWQLSTGPKGKELPFEVAGAAARSHSIRWGHLQDGKEVIAFAVDRPSQQAGTLRFAMDGEGQTSFRFAPAAPASQLRLTVYEHFIPTPVQIGAITGPDSMMSPLIAACDPKQYTLSGVHAPKGPPDH
jgi:hypothetical protein